ncbi:hypothetical protein KCU93_g2014, partial [Aureobasidium melanogenum]
MEPSDGHDRLSLPGMPTEILSHITDLVGYRSLAALRLTNKRLCSISNKRFATLRFSERRHLASAYSMDALVEITAHHFFGKYIRTVIICTRRPEPPENREDHEHCYQCCRWFPLLNCTNPAPEHRGLSSDRFRKKLDEVFTNVKRNSPSISIGIDNETSRFYGSNGYTQCVEIEKGPHNDRCRIYNAPFKVRDESYRIRETSEEIFQAAHRSGCEIKGVILRINDRNLDPYAQIVSQREQVQSLVHDFVTPLSKPPSIDLIFRDEGNWPRVTYDQDTSELYLEGLTFRSSTEYPLMFEYLQTLFDWLLAFPMTQIHIRDCEFKEPRFLKMFYKPTLQRLYLEGVSLETMHFDTNLWSSFLDELSRTTQLKFLKVLCANYQFLADCGDGDDEYLELPTGRYEINEAIKHTNSFCLVLSEHRIPNLVLADQEGICPQVKALADRVAKMEADKMAEIERDNFVEHHFVGVPNEPQLDFHRTITGRGCYLDKDSDDKIEDIY